MNFDSLQIGTKTEEILSYFWISAYSNELTSLKYPLKVEPFPAERSTIWYPHEKERTIKKYDFQPVICKWQLTNMIAATRRKDYIIYFY